MSINSGDLRLAVFGLLCVLGLSFWFFVGFPFANHNESYVIVSQLDRMTLSDALTRRIFPVANYRPLGQAVMWLGYRISGHSIAPVELFNFIGAAAAWILLFAALRERRVFALVGLIVGGVFFSGYVYLYHLHGVFYSPFLLSLAALFFLDHEPFSRPVFITVSVVACIASFFHPYAPLAYLAVVTGLYLTKRRMLHPHRFLIGVFWLISMILLVWLAIIPRHDTALTTREMIEGIFASYRMVEVRTMVSLVAGVLAVLTTWTLPVRRTVRGWAIGLAVILGCAIWSFHFPVLLLWIAICLLKALLQRKWWLFFLLAMCTILPAPAATGSPTYAIFSLFVCAAATVFGWEGGEKRIPAGATWGAGAIIALAVALLIMLKTGVPIPVLSKVALPVLAEQEKTYQLEQILEWYRGSEYRTRGLVLGRFADNPRGSLNAIDRRHRPPTCQEYLAKHLTPLDEWTEDFENKPGSLLVTFGDDASVAGAVVFRVPGRNAGWAEVALPSEGPER